MHQDVQVFTDYRLKHEPANRQIDGDNRQIHSPLNYMARQLRTRVLDELHATTGSHCGTDLIRDSADQLPGICECVESAAALHFAA